MFFEARGEGMEGMEAVAYNVLKRFEISFRGAQNICDVVTHPYQYSYLWDDVPDVVQMRELPIYQWAYNFAQQLVVKASVGEINYPKIGDCESGATHYHRWDVSPWWSDPVVGSMVKTCGQIGAHIFFVGK